jgi:predicted dienelactone hydrolase
MIGTPSKMTFSYSVRRARTMLLKIIFSLTTLGILFAMIGCATVQKGAEEQMEYKVGYRQYKWHDADRQRKVWVNVWYPAKDEFEEKPLVYGLGKGSVAFKADVSTRGVPFPLIVMSHGAMGSAREYGWIAEHLTRKGFVVLGVSHYRESWIYGPKTIDPGAVTRLWIRPVDCTFALDQILQHDDFRGLVDASRISALGHSSGGNTVVALGGAIFDPTAMGPYCMSEAAKEDRGCQYAKQMKELPPPLPPEAIASHRDPRVKAIVAMDPAAGPAYSESSLAKLRVPVLVIGSVDNDFLPFEHHAGRYATLIPNAVLIKLNEGEGHFVYLNSCTSKLEANGVPLCVDREGVDREAVHAYLAPKILDFLRATLNLSGRKGSTN